MKNNIVKLPAKKHKIYEVFIKYMARHKIEYCSDLDTAIKLLTYRIYEIYSSNSKCGKYGIPNALMIIGRLDSLLGKNIDTSTLIIEANDILKTIADENIVMCVSEEFIYGE